jgi:hypothetical protein
MITNAKTRKTTYKNPAPPGHKHSVNLMIYDLFSIWCHLFFTVCFTILYKKWIGYFFLGFHYIPFVIGGSVLCQLQGIAIFNLPFNFARQSTYTDRSRLRSVVSQGGCAVAIAGHRH